MISVKAPFCEKPGHPLHCGWLSKEDTMKPNYANGCRCREKGATLWIKARAVAELVPRR